MSDLSGNWSRLWFANKEGQQLILELIQSLLPGTLEGVTSATNAANRNEYHLLNAPNGKTELMLLCAETGGSIYNSFEEAMADRMEPSIQTIDTTLPLAVLVFLCALIDVVIRRIRIRRNIALQH